MWPDAFGHEDVGFARAVGVGDDTDDLEPDAAWRSYLCRAASNSSRVIPRLTMSQ